MRASGTRRQRGAYFTPDWLASRIARWAIRSAKDSVIDPSAGDGSLLAAAAQRLISLGGTPMTGLWGVELHRRTADRLARRLSMQMRPEQVVHANFFKVASALGRYDVVIGNPPFVRHHDVPRQTRDSMRTALGERAAVVGGRASTWAYFLVAGASLLAPGGRLAMILPVDVLSAEYAGEILKFLTRTFKSVTLARVAATSYSGLEVPTIACLADGYRPEGIPCAIRLTNMGESQKSIAGDFDCDVERGDLEGGTLGLTIAGPGARAILRDLADTPGIRPLGELARVRIGYVTGANRFFHLDEASRRKSSMKTREFKRVMTRSSLFAGTVLERSEWERLRNEGGPCWLFCPQSTANAAVARYLAIGRREQVNRAFKCRIRDRWWNVAVGEAAPGLIMVAFGDVPRLIANQAGVYVPNTLYAVDPNLPCDPRLLALASRTSVFQLSAASHSKVLAGGLRKIEPGAASRVLVPICDVPNIAHACKQVDELLRRRALSAARQYADELILRDGLGLTEAQVARVAEACRAATESAAGQRAK